MKIATHTPSPTRLIAIMAGLALAASSIQADTLITSDFEGSLGSWTASTGAALYTYASGTNYAPVGNGAANLPKSGGAITLSNALPLALQGYTSVTVAFRNTWLNGTTTRFLYVQYAADGVNFVNLAKVSNGNGATNAASSVTLNVGPSSASSVTVVNMTEETTYTGAPFTDTAKFRFVDNASAAADVRAYVDNIVITATPDFGGGPGPVDHFVISAISSPQTVGTQITGITITAEDSSNATATSFTGTVTFGGTGGFTGTSTSFTAGVLSGVSVTPTVAGSNLTFTVDDDSGPSIGSTTITTIQTQYAAWAGGALFDADANGDGVDNGLAFLLGASGPSAAVTMPMVTQSAGSLILSNFLSRNDANRGTATLSVQHSSDLGITDPWVSVPVTDAGTAASGVTFSVATGSPNNTVTATVSVSEAAAGRLFGRLKASE